MLSDKLLANNLFNLALLAVSSVFLLSKVSIQMAGGEDTIEFAKENDKVKVVTTLSAD